jgi:hypothetical protein
VKKSIFKFASQLGVKQIALGWRMSDRWAVGKHLGSKIKSRKVRQINFLNVPDGMFTPIRQVQQAYRPVP